MIGRDWICPDIRHVASNVADPHMRVQQGALSLVATEVGGVEEGAGLVTSCCGRAAGH